MTEEEVLKRILNTKGWYIGIYSANYAGVIKHRFENSKLTQGVIDMIILLSGYEVVQERKYQKKLSNS